MATNKRPQSCDECGHWVESGAGDLWRCLGSSSNCQRHWDDEGWHVTCSDKAACGSRKAQRKTDAQAEKAERKAASEKAAAEKAIRIEETAEALAKLTAGLVCTDTHPLRQSGELVLEGISAWGKSIRLYRHESGHLLQVVEHDAITRAWAPESQCEAWGLAWAAEMGIDLNRALNWMVQYRGCAGARVYEAVIRAAGLDPLALPAEIVEAAKARIVEEREREERERKEKREREEREYEARAARARAVCDYEWALKRRESNLAKLSQPAKALLAEIEAAGADGLVLAGSKKRTAQGLEGKALILITDGRAVAVPAPVSP